MLTSSDKHMWSKDGVTAKLLVPAVCCICIASRCATAQSIIFAELVVVETTTDATKEFWAGKCAEVPDEALFIKMEMDGNVDYFKPKERSTFCDMLTSSNKHMWSKDGVTEWRTCVNSARVCVWEKFVCVEEKLKRYTEECGLRSCAHFILSEKSQTLHLKMDRS